ELPPTPGDGDLHGARGSTDRAVSRAGDPLELEEERTQIGPRAQRGAEADGEQEQLGFDFLGAAAHLGDRLLVVSSALFRALVDGGEAISELFDLVIDVRQDALLLRGLLVRRELTLSSLVPAVDEVSELSVDLGKLFVGFGEAAPTLPEDELFVG